MTANLPPKHSGSSQHHSRNELPIIGPVMDLILNGCSSAVTSQQQLPSTFANYDNWASGWNKNIAIGWQNLIWLA